MLTAAARSFAALVLVLASACATTSLAPLSSSFGAENRIREFFPEAAEGVGLDAAQAREGIRGSAVVDVEEASGPGFYAQARYLAPALGRFLSADPFPGVLDEPFSTQGFIYGRANPLRYVDPTGMVDEEKRDQCIAAGSLALRQYQADSFGVRLDYVTLDASERTAISENCTVYAENWQDASYWAGGAQKKLQEARQSQVGRALEELEEDARSFIRDVGADQGEAIALYMSPADDMGAPAIRGMRAERMKQGREVGTGVAEKVIADNIEGYVAVALGGILSTAAIVKLIKNQKRQSTRVRRGGDLSEGGEFIDDGARMVDQPLGVRGVAATRAAGLRAKVADPPLATEEE